MRLKASKAFLKSLYFEAASDRGGFFYGCRQGAAENVKLLPICREIGSV